MSIPVHRLVALVLVLSSRALAGVDEDLAAAAKSPYDIAQFVDTHTDFAWTPLWKALGIKELHDHGDGYDDGVFLPPCDKDNKCSAELITVLDPVQVIVLLRSSEYYIPDVYLRFNRRGGPDQPGPWSFAGSYWNGGAGLRSKTRTGPLRNEAVSPDHRGRALGVSPGRPQSGVD